MNSNFSKKFSVTILLSLFFHFLIVLIISNYNKEIEIKKIFVVNLANYKEFNPTVIKKKPNKIEQTKKNNIEEVVEKEKKIKPLSPKKNTLKKEKLKKKIKEKLKPSVVKEKEINDVIIKKEKKVVEVQKKEEILNSPPVRVNKPDKFVKPEKNVEFLKDKALTNYLINISKEINLLANNSYPRKSIKRREQGRIISQLTLNSSGEILKVEILTKRPDSLSKAAKKVLEKKQSFSSPPQILFKLNNSIIVEVPINYVLK